MEQPSESGKAGIERSEASSSSEEFKMCLPDSGGSSGGSKESKSNNFSLRSSVLGSSLGSSSSSSTNSCSSTADNQNKSFVLNPPRLSTPFTKQSDDEKEKEKDKEGETPNSEKPEQKSPIKDKGVSDGGTSSKVSFVPLGWGSGSSGVSTSSSVSSSQVSSSPAFGSFVFGQNLREKVEGPKNNESTPEVSSTTDGHDHVNNVEEPKANGTTSEMLFSSAVKSESGDSKPSESSKSLSEAAREYEEARSVKRKFEPVQLITGEEHEQNVLQMNCKLFAYDKISSGWQERGRGLLRLNDSTPAASRLIIRAHGSLRVLINTKVWGEMVVQRASPKSLRITAMDNSETVKVFLISASQTEMDELQRYLQSRVRKSEKSCGSSNSTHSKKVKTDDSS